VHVAALEVRLGDGCVTDSPTASTGYASWVARKPSSSRAMPAGRRFASNCLDSSLRTRLRDALRPLGPRDACDGGSEDRSQPARQREPDVAAAVATNLSERAIQY